MNDSGDTLDVIAMIGKENLQWLATEFCRETKLGDLPEEILDRASSVDITLRDYSRDRNAGALDEGLLAKLREHRWDRSPPDWSQ